MDDILEEFDYTVSFPNLSARRASSENSKDPVVFLFGWAGCKDQYLVKYAQLWEKEGFATVRYTAPTPYIFWKQKEMMPVIGHKVVDLFEEMDLFDQPVIFHVFSGAGCMVLNAFLNALKERPEKGNLWDNFVGVVFDSAPARATYYQRALAYHGGGNAQVSQFRFRATIFVSICVMMMFDIFQYFLSFFWPVYSHHRYFDVLFRHKLPNNQLFLYSKADEICSHHHISEFAALQREKEARVQEVVFESSPHCQHFRYFQEEYREAVSEFVAKVFDDEAAQDFEQLEKPSSSNDSQ